MSPVAKRKPMTPTQREVLGRLLVLSGGTAGRWVSLEDIGSRTACEHLVRKGFAESRVERGKRGGKRAFYRVALPASRSVFASLDEQRDH